MVTKEVGEQRSLVCSLIESYFGDGEFLNADEKSRFETVDGSNDAIVAVYSKPFLLATDIGSVFQTRGITMLAKNGFFSELDLDYLKEQIGGKRLLFMADLDPPDLLNAAVLQLAFGKQLIFGPYNREFAEGLHPSMLARISMSMSSNEIEVLNKSISRFTSIEDALGIKFLELYRSGQKIEIDSMLLVRNHFESWLDGLSTRPDPNDR